MTLRQDHPCQPQPSAATLTKSNGHEAGFQNPVVRQPGRPIPAIRLMLVDDHHMVAESLGRLLATAPDLDVVAVANSGEEAIRDATALEPDVVLMDIQLPDRSGFDVASEILRRSNRKIKILFLSGSVVDLHIRLALKMRSGGVVGKNCSVSFLMEAVRKVASGQQAFDPEVESRLESGPDGAKQLGPTSALAELSFRKLEILGHLARGLSVKEIAELLHLSEKAVDSHKYRIMKELDVHDRVELALLAVREGLLQP
ncbi:response regulator transcription factor [Planctomicrobium piriforme]|uniref:DNA-binding response regulator, NarL/FixJ family, contains REC and HTH domains n=1 Tax=Planctomicrobium piriforme TaxID=1576369 RepID=A0A1I3STI9_9PLAN|nr:response regulator transcription factor [Planctomicrobium piriforme]SFJ60717.1 DNA-binding response regulator, NarL/FixJ family, contains REC and HTH domains [Planctomicrobium piriforme]